MATGNGQVTGEEISSALSGIEASHRYQDPGYSSRTMLSAAVPIFHAGVVSGVVVARQSGEEYLS